MSKSDDSSKQFVISAHVVRQLGEQLISDEITALVELVKNSYDADASSVGIIVNTAEVFVDEDLSLTAYNNKEIHSFGYILISDNGTGMDENSVSNGWLQISFSTKRQESKSDITSPRFKRAFLGSKGVGRLSAQRLGNRLDLFSLKESYIENEDRWQRANVGVHVGVNWEEFKENIRLQDVPVFFKNWFPKNGKPGTKVVITDLKNPKVWVDEDSRNALVSTLAQLISPFEAVKGFKIRLKINNLPYDLFELTKGVRDTAISTYTFSYDEKVLKIKGKIKTSLFRGGNSNQDAQDYQKLISPDNGFAFFEFLNQTKGLIGLKSSQSGWFFEYEIILQNSSLGLILEEVKVLEIDEDGVEKEVISKQIASPGPFHGEIDQLAYENSEVNSSDTVFSQIGEYKAYVKKQAGIRIYRDGFGIRPYGIDGDDWIGFQAGTTSGRSFYGLRPKNVIGYIALSAKENRALEEKTDREGFVLNDASRNFFILTSRVRDEINGVLTRVRRRFNDYKKKRAVEEANITSPGEMFGNLRQTAERVSALHEKAHSANTEAVFSSIERKLTAIRQNPLLETPTDATLGALLEEAKSELGKLKDIQVLIDEMYLKQKNIAPYASFIESQLQQLNYQLTDFSELAGVGLTAEALTHEIDNIVHLLLHETDRIAAYLRRQPNVAPEILLFIERVQASMQALRRQTTHLDPSMRYMREKKEMISLNTFLDGVRTFYEARIRFREANIHFNISDKSDTDFIVYCSRGKLTQIMDNIIINSEYWLRESLRQRIIDKASISIKLRNPFVEISDNGIGIDPGIVPQLFQPFVTTKPKESGRGLGLFITHQLLESMNCIIDLLPDLNNFQRPYIFRIDLTGTIYEQSST